MSPTDILVLEGRDRCGGRIKTDKEWGSEGGEERQGEGGEKDGTVITGETLILACKISAFTPASTLFLTPLSSSPFPLFP